MQVLGLAGDRLDGRDELRGRIGRADLRDVGGGVVGARVVREVRVEGFGPLEVAVAGGVGARVGEALRGLGDPDPGVRGGLRGEAGGGGDSQAGEAPEERSGERYHYGGGCGVWWCWW